MLSTKDMSAGGGRISPLVSPGNVTFKVNDVTLQQTPYDKDAYNIYLHVESKPIGGDFQGFLRDRNNEALGRYEGQVGRVRASQYPFKDTTLPSGRDISRDQEILKTMIFLASAFGVREELDMIEADTIEDFVSSAGPIICTGSFVNACLGSREWENNEGYINNDLYLPRVSKDGVPIEQEDVENSRLLTFDRETHVRPVVKKESTETSKFEPTKSSVGDDFDL